jgi:hypothetical protein
MGHLNPHALWSIRDGKGLNSSQKQKAAAAVVIV